MARTGARARKVQGVSRNHSIHRSVGPVLFQKKCEHKELLLQLVGQVVQFLNASGPRTGHWVTVVCGENRPALIYLRGSTFTSAAAVR